jgi:hypothetical protein
MTSILLDTLEPPMTATNGRFGLLSASPVVQLLLHQKAGRRLRHEARDPLRRGVRAVGAAEGVVDVEIGQRRQLLGEARIVLFFFGVEAQVLQQQHAARRQRRHRLLRRRAHAVLGEGHRRAQQRRQRIGHRAQAHLRDALAVGASQVGHQDHLGALLAQVIDGRQRLLDALVALHLAVLEGDVEVDAHDDALAGRVQVFDEQLLPGIHADGFTRLRRGLSTARRARPAGGGKSVMTGRATGRRPRPLRRPGAPLP